MWFFSGIQFCTILETLIACRVMQLRFFEVETLLNNAFNIRCTFVSTFFSSGIHFYTISETLIACRVMQLRFLEMETSLTKHLMSRSCRQYLRHFPDWSHRCRLEGELPHDVGELEGMLHQHHTLSDEINIRYTEVSKSNINDNRGETCCLEKGIQISCSETPTLLFAP